MLGVASGSLTVFVIGSLVAGAGQGVAMSGAVRALLHGGDASERASIFAAIYLISYSGAALASFVSGQLTTAVSLLGITAGYGALTLLAAGIVVSFARNPVAGQGETPAGDA